MKRLLQESEEEIMVTLGSSCRLSPDKAKAETVCGIKSKSSGPAGSLPEDSSLPPCCGSTASAIDGDRDGDLAQHCSFGQEAGCLLPLGSTACASGSGSQDLSSASNTTSCQEPSERNQTKPLLSGGQGWSLEQREPVGDVVDYIIRELRGISRLQTEIAELQQHLSQVQGSVDEVSSCVDSVLSEIEGLQVGSSSLAKVCVGGKVQEPHVDTLGEEAILYLYGLPEQDGEDTMELVHSFLAKHLCVNGMQCNRYIKEAYRAGRAQAPRPTVVKLAHLEHRDFLLQKSILLQSVGVRIAIREEPAGSQYCKNSPKESLSFLQQQLQDHNSSSLIHDKPVLQTETGEPITGAYQIRAQNQHREPLTPEQQGLCFPLRNDSAKPSDLSKPGDEVNGPSSETSQVISGSCGRTGREASPSALHQFEEPSLVLIPKEEDAGKSQVFKQCDQGLEAYEVAKRENNYSDKSEASNCLSLSGLLKTEENLLACEAGLDILSSKQLEDLLTDKTKRFAALSCDSMMEEIIIRPETFGDMVHIDLNEEEERAAQVLKDVFEKSSCVGGSQEDEDIEIKFYTSKLGRAIHHFRSALQGVFQKLENGASISPEDPESNESCSQSENSDRLLGTVSSGGAQDLSVESPESQESESLLSVVSGRVGATQGDPASHGPSNFSLASHNSPLTCSLPGLILAPGQGLDNETCPRPESPTQGTLSLEQVCAETIYLNRCINNFKNVLREKRLRQKKLLHELVQKANHLSVEDLHPGIPNLCFIGTAGYGLHMASIRSSLVVSSTR